MTEDLYPNMDDLEIENLREARIAAKPTRDLDLRNVREHHWVTRDEAAPACEACGLVLVIDGLFGIPPCPGPGYILIRRPTATVYRSRVSIHADDCGVVEGYACTCGEGR